MKFIVPGLTKLSDFDTEWILPLTRVSLDSLTGLPYDNGRWSKDVSNPRTARSEPWQKTLL